MILIEPICTYKDNYVWLIINPASGNAIAVDPGDAAPVQAFIRNKTLTLSAILITHHHWDHVNGVGALVAEWRCPVYGPGSVDCVDQPVRGGDTIDLAAESESSLPVTVHEIPGHTADHIGYHLDKQGALFCGDTLFSAGCGRLLGGTAEQLKRSLDFIKTLPIQTRIYGAHEYTMANLRFAHATMPNNKDVVARMRDVESLRANNQPSIPSTLEAECRYNPFLRCNDDEIAASLAGQFDVHPKNELEVFTLLRKWKDHF